MLTICQRGGVGVVLNDHLVHLLVDVVGGHPRLQKSSQIKLEPGLLLSLPLSLDRTAWTRVRLPLNCEIICRCEFSTMRVGPCFGGLLHIQHVGLWSVERQ